jgi:uncharacterized protein (DUF1499 family)
MGLFSGRRPDNLGVSSGKLKACPNKPNCVNSQANPESSHFIAPLHYTGDATRAWQALYGVISGMERVAVIKHQPDYLYAEFTTRLMGFVDDTEFYLDPAGQVIHARSASRLGYRDFDVNRERVEAIRVGLAAALA